MGFLDAMMAIGGLNPVSGWESYLKFPLEAPRSTSAGTGKGKAKADDGHKVIRIWLNVEDPAADQLKVTGIEKIDLVDYKVSADMKMRYLYRDRIGANVTWGFSPILKIGKPKKDINARLEALVGETGRWRQEHESIYNKLLHRLLNDFEASGTLSPGSVDTIMNHMTDQVNHVAEIFEGKGSFIIVFGVNDAGNFQYPGELRPFVRYFKDKLSRHVQKDNANGEGARGRCYCCGQSCASPATLDKVFKFSTFDKVNVLPGLDKDSRLKVQPVCQDCLERLTAGRELIERELTDKSTIPRITIWVVPEVIGVNGSSQFLEQALRKLKSNDNIATGMGQEAERRFFDRLIKQDRGLVFHFLFWERSNAQERIHLMVEDVPPSRLAFLGKAWKSVCEEMSQSWNTTLDGAMSTLYATCLALSGMADDKADKAVMRDFVVKIIGKMLMGEEVPTESFKVMFVSRVPKLVFDSTQWKHVKRTTRNAQLVVEFLERVNKEVASI